MTITRSFRHLFILAAVALPAGILSQPVEARSVGAALGVVAPGDASCLSYFFATVTNTCARTISIDWPLVVDTGGSKHVGIDALGPTSTQNVICRAEGLNEETTLGFFSNGGAYAPLPGIGASTNITMDGASVPGGGQLLVNCQVQQGGRIQVANWNV
ncbi:MAG TPA: hypothetical protein VHW23_36440 [Kofleriaceae bacterium]|nr:hypothetical protein [Kofleriaceae bacterium]